MHTLAYKSTSTCTGKGAYMSTSTCTGKGAKGLSLRWNVFY